MLTTLFRICFVAALAMAVCTSVDPIAVCRNTLIENEIPAPLEVHIASPPRWENGCLLVHVERTNRSSAPIFLTDMGPYLDMAIDVHGPDARAEEEFEWGNLHGVSDIISLDGVPLSPGATVRNDFCLGPYVWVVNLEKETRREIPVRGKMRVRVSYFLSEDSLKRYKDWFNQSPPYRARGESTDPPADVAPKWAEMFAEIPCFDTTCKSGCSIPPAGVAGEVRLVPDVFFLTPEWGDRGKAMTDDLARKFPSCTVEKPVVR